MRSLLQLLTLITLPVAAGWLNAALQPATTPTTVHWDYPEELPGAYTGGFGEPTCHSCHFDYDLNMADGSLEADLPEGSYEPGQRYPLEIRLNREDLGKGGFQMTARFEDGSQAGTFEPSDDRVAFTPVTNGNLQYIQHSEAGTAPLSPGEISWSLAWTAPEEAGGTIQFHIAANAANGDVSEFGDWIYVKETSLDPQ